MKHLSIRVAWHDNKWNGSVCNQPEENSYCLQLPRIYEEKDEDACLACKTWREQGPEGLPPCKAESGGFMAETSYKRTFKHPYSNNKNLPHNNLFPTTVNVPEFSTFAVPFGWMLRKEQKRINSEYLGLPKDEKPPFATAWVFGRERQKAILETFFNPIEAKKSLVIFYTKSGQPVDENTNRLIVGIGTISEKSPIIEYDSSSSETYPFWDRLIEHSIRPNDQKGGAGFLIPYHEYLELPDDYKVKIGGQEKDKDKLLDEIKLTLHETGSDEGIISQFSYGSEWVENSTVLNLLHKCRKVIENVKEHGVVTGAWDSHLSWIEKQISLVKEYMGPFPSFANALTAFGFEWAHSLEQDLRDKNLCEPKDDPWKLWDKLLENELAIDGVHYQSKISFYKDTWTCLPEEEKKLLKLLSRFELTTTQIKKWFSDRERNKRGYEVTPDQILENPYLIAELDDGDKNHYPISVETIDLGLFEDKAIQGENIPEEPSRTESPIDKRRIRAISIKILKDAANDGDTLLSFNEVIERLAAVKLTHPATVPDNYIVAYKDYFSESLSIIATEDISALQLQIYEQIESWLKKIFLARAKKKSPVLDENWEELVKDAIAIGGIDFDESDVKHTAALKDQALALQKLTSRKLTVLHGPAGTGKTTVMGALFRSSQIQKEGTLLLAPTGKARVRLGSMADCEAMTIAQFLTRQKRFNWEVMKPKFTGPDKYKAEQNVIIDECSMLTIEDFYALLQALDLAHVKRIILVGDPYQLPPIGPGRPFADFCSYLNEQPHDDKLKGALAQLEVVVRTRTSGPSDTLTLASWFSGLKPMKNADEVFAKLGDNDSLNDLRVECWGKAEDLPDLLMEVLTDELDLENEADIAGFDKYLGLDDTKQFQQNPEQAESFQMLSPVRNPAWGTLNLNKLIQSTFRPDKKRLRLGDQQITWKDKVIQLVNEKKNGYPSNSDFQLSNGQIGAVVGYNKGYGNISFSGIAGQTFGYNSKDFGEDASKVELAYAITVHKSQGSDFRKVILVLPQKGRIMSRELLYTAMTRAKDKIILLVEGDNPQRIINLSKPQYSETARRNSHLFFSSIREQSNVIPYAEGLIHKTLKPGLFVRSKSEVIIANMLYERNIEFEYEREFEGVGGKRLPDFTFVDAAGELVILEHLGMLHKPSYKAEWDKKLIFYQENDFEVDENLFVTRDEENGSIDSERIEEIINVIKEMI